MLNISKAQLDRAYQEARDALTLAYGQRHETPDGKVCWIGRIKRADDVLLKNQDDKTRKNIEKLVSLATKDLEWAERKQNDYLLLCLAADVKAQTIEADCTCAYCQIVPTMHWG